MGVVGMGAIGRGMAAALLGLGARVVAHDPFRPPSGLDVPYLDLPDLLATSDAVTLHCPMPADGRPLLDRSALSRLPPGAILVNTARAGLVDDGALVARLGAGHLRAYATDVFAEEPASDDPLACHLRVIGTRHVGAVTEESVRRATEAAIANLLAVLAPDALSKDGRAAG